MKFKAVSEDFIKKMEWLGVLGVLVMIIITFINVVGAKLFSAPLRGATEIVSFAQIIAITFVIAVNLLDNRHIAIDFLVDRMPKLIRKWIRILVIVLESVLFAILCYESFRYGLSLQRAGEISSGAYIPFYPFAFAISFGSACVLLFFLNELITIFIEERGENNDPN